MVNDDRNVVKAWFLAVASVRLSPYMLPSSFLCAALSVATNPLPTLGEPGFDLKTWHSEDGLPSDAVMAIAQTGDGYP